jgi:Ni/Co efflux regulator RcnB
MADRHDIDRERDQDRERNAGRDWDREREHRSAHREEWDRNRHEGGEGRYEEYGRPRRAGDERTADYGNRGDWGRTGSWGTFGNRPDYRRDDYWREDWQPEGLESDWGGYNTRRTNLFGTGGGGFGSGFSSYGTGVRSYGGGMGSYGDRGYGERGRYSGRGPKGWQRSDERIREDVNERLTDHPHIDASEIEVKVSNGEITLTGTVEDRQSKRLAEDIADSVSGVREVHNQLRVGASQQGEPVRVPSSTTTRHG